MRENKLMQEYNKITLKNIISTHKKIIYHMH
jgi:hypothetical protein